MAVLGGLFILLLYFKFGTFDSDVLCDSGFCRTYQFEEGCVNPAQECRINNATHTGLWMRSPTTCNCCDFCLPFFVKGAHCSLGGPGTGTTVGRCGHGLTCVADPDDGDSYCWRMESECHSAQDDYDKRHEEGAVGALESRPNCDGKAKYDVFECVPTQSCFCQSEEGERIFGETVYVGAATERNIHCGCSRIHEKIRKNIGQGVPYPVIGPRCTADGHFNPVQCLNRVCYCVDRTTGVISRSSPHINLNENPLTELPCYDPDLDLFPSQSAGDPPYNYTTPCFESMIERIEFIEKSAEDGFNVDFYNTIPECLPDGTYGRMSTTRNLTKICVNQNGQQLEDYEASPDTQQYRHMDCKCAQTSSLMASSTERPVCCKNGNFRTIQCRRGLCRCVDFDGRQFGRESADVNSLPCFRPNWRDLDSIDCYAKPLNMM